MSDEQWKVLIVRVPADAHAQIQALAKRHHITAAMVAREMIRLGWPLWLEDQRGRCPHDLKRSTLGGW